MPIQKGSLFLLKVGDGGGTEVFTTIGGFRTTRMNLENQVLDATHRGSGAWRGLLQGGRQSLSISGQGLFADTATEETVRGFAFSNLIKNYRLAFGNGDTLTAAFMISAYERSADVAEEEVFSITLESAGTVNFVAA